MSRVVLLAAVALACVQAVPFHRLSLDAAKAASINSEESSLFQSFKRRYNKFYFDQHDESFRQSVFVQNLRMIRAHNEANQHKYTLAMNSFGDLTFEEFHAKHTGFLGLRHQHIRSKNVADLSHVKVADSVDWVSAGAVTDVKNQGQCGSCWAFSTTGAIEGAWKLAGNALVSLSEQQLMDCSKSEGNYSCEGGLMDDAFEYVIKNGGICSEASYPYQEADQDSCKSCTTVAKISGYKDVAQSEDALKAAVTLQPVSVAIEADQQAFQFYSGGVLTGTCGTQLDHGVLAVGFGTLDGTDYWKVKNSWGGDWGMQGFVLIERGVDQCGIHDAASYPVV